MRNLVIGLAIGLAIGGVLLILGLQFGGAEEQALIARQKLDLAAHEKTIERLNEQNREIEALRRKTWGLKETLQAEVRQLQDQLDDASETTAALKARLEETRKQPVHEPELPGETSAEDELAKVQREAIEKYSRILKVGQPLSEEARKELEVDEATEARINGLLSDEAARITSALAQFCRENIPDPPKDLSDWTSQALLGKIAPEMMQEMAKLGQLTQEDHLKIARGEKDLLDYLPRDSQVMKLAYAMHKVRRETYRQVERELPPEKMDTFKDKYLPPNDFLFPGNLNMAFGKIDWEKER